MIYIGLCACTEMLWMCVLYASFGFKVRPMGALPRVVLCCVFLGPDCSIFCNVNRVQVVLSGFSMKLFCFVQAKTL